MVLTAAHGREAFEVKYIQSLNNIGHKLREAFEKARLYWDSAQIPVSIVLVVEKKSFAPVLLVFVRKFFRERDRSDGGVNRVIVGMLDSDGEFRFHGQTGWGET